MSYVVGKKRFLRNIHYLQNASLKSEAPPWRKNTKMPLLTAGALAAIIVYENQIFRQAKTGLILLIGKHKSFDGHRGRKVESDRKTAKRCLPWLKSDLKGEWAALSAETVLAVNFVKTTTWPKHFNCVLFSLMLADSKILWYATSQDIW